MDDNMEGDNPRRLCYTTCSFTDMDMDRFRIGPNVCHLSSVSRSPFRLFLSTIVPSSALLPFRLVLRPPFYGSVST